MQDKLLGVLSRERLDALIAREAGAYRTRLYPPRVVLGLFIEQVMSSDPVCQDAVGRHLSQRTVLGLKGCSLNTGPYCKARQRLPLGLIESCAREVAAVACAQLAAGSRWRGRELKLIDGTTVSMPDTPALQAWYPQNARQAAGVGFPLARIVGVVSLASGCVWDWTIGACAGEGTGEVAQLRRLLEGFAPGDVAIADRLYCSYFLLAAMQGRGVDFVVREHDSRKNDPQSTVRIAPNDQWLTWQRPQRPAWMDAAAYAAMPQTLRVREVRDGTRLLVTSLIDPDAVGRKEIAWLYTQRWHIELDFRAIKGVMQMDVLRCKSPDMVRKEIAAHLLAYNLIRAVTGQAAKPEGLCIRQLSFAAARRAAVNYQHTLRYQPTHQLAARFVMLQAIAHWRIPDRPGRIEPRAIKRRPKPRPLLHVTRQIARTRIRESMAASLK